MEIIGNGIMKRGGKGGVRETGKGREIGERKEKVFCNFIVTCYNNIFQFILFY